MQIIRKSSRLFCLIALLSVFCVSLAMCQTAPPSTGDLPEAKPVKVFLCAGQSNMAGAGNRSGLSEEDAKLFPDEEILFWFADPAQKEPTTEWSTLGATAGKFGPEQLFAIEMKKLFPEHRIAIVKVSRGATPIHYWLPSTKEDVPDPAGNRTLVETIATVNKHFYAEKAARAIPDWSWGGFAWMQGEGDANGTMAPAGVYLEKLKKLASLVREKTSTEKLPIVIGRLSSQISPSVVRETGMLRVSKAKSPDGKGLPENVDFVDDGKRRGPIWFDQKLRNVRADQEAFCQEDSCAGWADIDDLTVKDTYHYDAGGYAEMGRRFAAVYRKITGIE